MIIFSLSETKAKKLQAKADAEGDLKDTTATRDTDVKYLADLTATCEQKASDFESRQQLRADEILAIEKAIEIISSNAAPGNTEKHLPTMLQTSSFVQLRADFEKKRAIDIMPYDAYALTSATTSRNAKPMNSTSTLWP